MTSGKIVHPTVLSQWETGGTRVKITYWVTRCACPPNTDPARWSLKPWFPLHFILKSILWVSAGGLYFPQWILNNQSINWKKNSYSNYSIIIITNYKLKYLFKNFPMWSSSVLILIHSNWIKNTTQTLFYVERHLKDYKIKIKSEYAYNI